MLTVLLVALPSVIKIPAYRLLLGYRIGRNVKIGFSWVAADELEIGDGVRIGHFNRIKRIPYVSIGAHTIISNANTFTASPEFTSAHSRKLRENRPRLIIGEHCGIGLAHYFDVQDELSIGRFTTIAGMGSAFWTHYLDVESSTQSTKPLFIGEYCMVGAGAKFVPGAGLGDRCVVALGSVVTKPLLEPLQFVAGNPARPMRALSPQSKYFHRTTGFVSSADLAAPD